LLPADVNNFHFGKSIGSERPLIASIRTRLQGFIKPKGFARGQHLSPAEASAKARPLRLRVAASAEQGCPHFQGTKSLISNPGDYRQWPY
jgi:hypothetical protein